MTASNVKSICMIVNGKNADDPAPRESLAWAEQQGRRINVRVTRDEGDAVHFDVLPRRLKIMLPPETPLFWQ